MTKVQSICLVTEGYPAKGDPFFPFVELLCQEFSRNGISVTVICPQSITYCLKYRIKPHPWKRVDQVEGGIPIKVYQPYCLSFGYKYRHFNYKLFKLTTEWTFGLLKLKPDVCYAHFWYPGYSVHKCAKKSCTPLFVATGEANLKQFEKEFQGDKDFMNYTKGINGLICVSSENKRESVRMGLITPEKCIVVPNAVDEKLFYARNRNELRKKFGYDENDFIVCFVGAFINRKGSNRVSEAISKLHDSSIKSFFIGSAQGDNNLVPSCDGILKMGKVQHDDLPEYLSMADVFVLPTLYEGCCNAIVEALACGLPVVSSDLSFNHDILDKTNSILINPEDVDAIANAIKELKDNPTKRKQLAEGALAKGEELTIRRRAQRILTFIEERI